MESGRPGHGPAQNQARRLSAIASASMAVRLQKFLADAGVASRGASERVILEGRVTVNGTTIQQLGTKIQPGTDKIAVDGQALKPRRKLYVALHKPPGYTCTRGDGAARHR